MKNAYRYTESGLTNVWLANGYTIRKTKYGEGVSIHDMDGLHRALARALSNKPRLTGTEVRFLRKEMGLSQRGLGEPAATAVARQSDRDQPVQQLRVAHARDPQKARVHRDRGKPGNRVQLVDQEAAVAGVAP